MAEKIFEVNCKHCDKILRVRKAAIKQDGNRCSSCSRIKKNKYFLRDDYAVIIPNNATDKEILCDVEDLDFLLKYSWYLSGSYARSKIGYMHRVLMDAQKYQEEVDHIHHNKLDNRRKNLRKAEYGLNQRNAPLRRDNTTGYKGVYFSKVNKKYIANIREGGNIKYLGGYKTAEEAAKVYNENATRIFGEFAHLNPLSESV